MHIKELLSPFLRPHRNTPFISSSVSFFPLIPPAMTTTEIATDDNKSAKDFLTNLPEVLEKARIEGGIKGMSVAIMHKGELVFAEGFGKRNQTEPFTKEV